MSDIVKGGLVDTDGQLMQGDQILSVNGEDVRTATQEAMAALLKVREAELANYTSALYDCVKNNVPRVAVLRGTYNNGSREV